MYLSKKFVVKDANYLTKHGVSPVTNNGVNFLLENNNFVARNTFENWS